MEETQQKRSELQEFFGKVSKYVYDTMVVLVKDKRETKYYASVVLTISFVQFISYLFDTKVFHIYRRMTLAGMMISC